MAVGSIDVSFITTAAERAAAAAAEAKAPTKDIDKEAFLQLLVAQMKNQDPSNPMDSSQLMTQTTQLSTLEQLTAIADTTRESFALQMRMAASELIGKQVTYADADGVKTTAVATAVNFDASVPTIKVGDKDVNIDAISAVTAPTSTPAPTTQS